MARRTTAAIVGVGFQADTGKFTSGVKRVTKGTKDARFQMNRMRGQLRRLNRTLVTTVARYASFGAALAAVGGAAGIARATRGVLAHGRALEQFSQQTNLSIRELDGWSVLLAESGLELEDLADVIATANERLAEFGRGESTAIDVLRALGLEQRALNGEFQTGEQLLLAVAEAYNQLARSGRQAVASAALTEAFGDVGRRFIPVISETGGDLQGGARRAGEQAGGGLTDEQGRSLSRLDKNLIRVGQTLTNQFRRLIANNTNQLESLLDTFERGASEIIRSVDENMNDLINAVNTLGSIFSFFLNILIENLQNVLNSILVLGGANFLFRIFGGIIQSLGLLSGSLSTFGAWLVRIISGFIGLTGIVGTAVFVFIDIIGRMAGLGSIANWLAEQLGGLASKIIEFLGFDLTPDTTTREGAPTPPDRTRTEPGAIRSDTELIQSNSELQQAIEDLTRQVRRSILQSIRQARQQLSSFSLSDEDQALRENRTSVLAPVFEELDRLREEELFIDVQFRTQTAELDELESQLLDQRSRFVERLNDLNEQLGRAVRGEGIPLDEFPLGSQEYFDEYERRIRNIEVRIEGTQEALDSVQAEITNATAQRTSLEGDSLQRLEEIRERAEALSRIVQVIQFGATVDLTPLEQQTVELLEQLDADTQERFRRITLRRELDLAIDSDNARRQFLESIDGFVDDVRGGVDERLDDLSQRIFSRGLNSEVEAFSRRTLMELEELLDSRREELRKNVEDARRVQQLAEGAVFLGLEGAEQELVEATEALEAAVAAEEVFIDTIDERRLEWRRGIKDMEDAVREANIKEQFLEIRESIENSMETAFENIIFDGESLKDAFKQLVGEIIKEIIRIAIIRPLVQNITGGLFGFGGGAGIPGLQSGGLANTGFAVVGEAGPEIVDFQRPARVYSNEDLAAALGSGGGSGSITIIQNIDSSDGPGVRSALAEATPQIIEAANGRIYNDLSDRNSSVSQLVRNRARE